MKGPFIHLTWMKGPFIVQARASVGDWRAARRVPEFGIAAEISHENDFVYAAHARNPFKSSAILNSEFSGVNCQVRIVGAQELRCTARLPYALSACVC